MWNCIDLQYDGMGTMNQILIRECQYRIDSTPPCNDVRVDVSP